MYCLNELIHEERTDLPLMDGSCACRDTRGHANTVDCWCLRRSIHRQQVLWRHSSAGSVSLLITNPAPFAPRSPRTPKTRFSVRHTDKSHVLLRPVPQNFFHLATTRDRQIQANSLADLVRMSTRLELIFPIALDKGSRRLGHRGIPRWWTLARSVTVSPAPNEKWPLTLRGHFTYKLFIIFWCREGALTDRAPVRPAFFGIPQCPTPASFVQCDRKDQFKPR